MASVVSASLGASGPLLLKLAGLLGGKYGRLKGVRREIISLRCELSSMDVAVKKYAMLEDFDIQVKEWMSIVRELAYDIEDCIDNFIRRLGNGRRHGGFKALFRKAASQLKTLGARSRFADQIDQLKARIKQAKELRNSYKLDDATGSTSSYTTLDPRLSALFAEEAHLVGVGGPRDDLIKWMVDQDNNFFKHRRVLSIVGFGGMGKTTLANEVYRKIRAKFDCSAFVSVSQKPDIKRIVKNIISQSQNGLKPDTSEWEEEEFIPNLQKLLQDKRYLIIIDDIWSESAWDAIKYAFPENKCSSRIIVTTRIVDVARSCCRGVGNHLYKMKALTDLQSRSLFFKRIFGPEESCPDMLKQVSSEILKKCGGLPLAINNISGLLANKPTVKEEWEKVKKSIGFALEKSLDGMNTILCLSYNDLPANLKTCLLYLCVFPEDYEIDRNRLVRRWIGEGFISEEGGFSPEEVAEHYFYELINKSLVQPVEINYDGKVRACRVHDMMLEILISKSNQDNFITVVGGGQTSFSNRHGFIRLLSVQHIDQVLASALAKDYLRHVRSLTVTSSSCIKYLPSLIKFEALRVLDLEDCKGLDEYDMEGVEKLFQLKYLTLGATNKLKLPSGILKLGDLETLDLRNTPVQNLPAGFAKLTKLQHLLAGSQTKIPKGIGNMTNLRLISGFDIMMSPAHVVEELGHLVSLVELKVHFDCGGFYEYNLHEEKLLSSLCKLGSCRLESLQIDKHGGSLEFIDSWSPLPFSLRMCRTSGSYYFTNIPKWIVPSLSSLAYLEINLTVLTEEGLQSLGELPALLCLKFWLEPGVQDIIRVKGTGFSCLKEFSVFCMGQACVTFVKGAMPKLEELDVPCLVSVAKTYGFYLGIQHLPLLKQSKARLGNKGATSSETKAAATSIRNEARAHPNNPTVTIWGEPRDSK